MDNGPHYAYFLLADHPRIAAWRVGRALRFPLHLTLRGPFRPAPGFAVEDLAAVGSDVIQGKPVEASLVGPVHIEGGIVWLEVEGGTPAHSRLAGLHEGLQKRLKQRGVIGADLVPADFRGRGFRPHVTLSFSDPLPRDLPWQVVALTFRSWGLFEYDGDHIEERFRRPLAGERAAA